VRMSGRNSGKKKTSSRRLLWIDSGDWRILGLGRLLQVPPQSWLGEYPSRPGRSWQVRLLSWSTPVSSTSSGVQVAVRFGGVPPWLWLAGDLHPHGDRVISPRMMPFSQVIEQEWRRWMPFRRALSKEDQEAFDRMFACAKLQLQAEVPLKWPWRSQPC
jgi:hypothetical protein